MNLQKLSKRPKVFKRMFGLSPEQFNQLVANVEPLWKEAEQRKRTGFKRKRAVGAGRKRSLSLGHMIAMLLFYYRTYLPHMFVAEIFRVSDASVCRYLKQVQPLMDGIFDIHQEVIEISPDEVLRLCVDATEQETQKRTGGGYSGKKKRHTIKTQMTVDEQGKIHHISKSVAGNIHDKKLFDHTNITFPKDVPILGDLGYVGTDLSIPHKSSKLHKLTPLQEQKNQQHSKLRIIVEHVFAHLKKWGILKHRFRNQLKGYSSIFTIIAGIYNLKFAE
jgi:hypothetical protein